MKNEKDTSKRLKKSENIKNRVDRSKTQCNRLTENNGLDLIIVNARFIYLMKYQNLKFINEVQSIKNKTSYYQDGEEQQKLQ